MKCGMAWLGNRMGMWGWPKIPWRNWRTVLNFFFFRWWDFPERWMFCVKLSFGNSDVAMEIHTQSRLSWDIPGRSPHPGFQSHFPGWAYIFSLGKTPVFLKLHLSHDAILGPGRVDPKFSAFSRLQDQVAQESTLEVEASWWVSTGGGGLRVTGVAFFFFRQWNKKSVAVLRCSIC